MMKTAAIIPAGGSGRRLGGGIAKQYLLLDSLPVLVHTIRVFQKSDVISEIVLVVPQDDIAYVRKQIVEKYDLTKVAAVVAGGNERQDSVRNGLRAIAVQCDVVMVHDGVRPFVTEAMIAQVAAAAFDGGAASMGVKAKDTIKETTDENMVTGTLPRRNLWQTQTPQAFQYGLLCRAFEAAARDKFYGTDDASLVERTGAKVRMIAGSYGNIKITTPEDLLVAEALMMEKMKEQIIMRSGLGYDSHRFAPDRKLILGGVEIPFDRGLAGHSDADALLHAVCDALLGMAGAGDIGRHFPDSDPAYKNISSLILLERVKQIIEAKGMSINNIDVTVMTEKPRLAPYAEAIAASIAGTLNIPEAVVNIKAKTNESMGFVGREEGIAVLAIANGMERIVNA
ncbi:MAG: bifunctional 2-C-methyl-D-erythritol 4-phosphate cytidylyltransferase/2-C-methyl-D-erythritol 2,4-cyclodiphosphate synthase [Deltaproteobacteria bacterium HGW-Deltaproteobacteria-6]|nr:MAG: bifunctional 2-C-methyl-D-erythritol 4-phosphate cytidylyltransferase/2-C-methyl-D-erythritol 2,4-cyclodiphosphate synthase [Deltaproteobacteria bacterium HGW-Deltaproteobacteria-6]